MDSELAEHKQAVQKAFTDAKVVIITVGQPEIWYDKRDGSVFPMVPPTEIFDPEIHAFRMSTYQENLENLNRCYELLKQNQFRGLPLPAIRMFLRQILSAMAAMEDAHVIHCDLKPENILLQTAATGASGHTAPPAPVARGSPPPVENGDASAPAPSNAPAKASAAAAPAADEGSPASSVDVGPRGSSASARRIDGALAPDATAEPTAAAAFLLRLGRGRRCAIELLHALPLGASLSLGLLGPQVEC